MRRNKNTRNLLKISKEETLEKCNKILKNMNETNKFYLFIASIRSQLLRGKQGLSFKQKLMIKNWEIPGEIREPVSKVAERKAFQKINNRSYRKQTPNTKYWRG